MAMSRAERTELPVKVTLVSTGVITHWEESIAKLVCNGLDMLTKFGANTKLCSLSIFMGPGGLSSVRTFHFELMEFGSL